MPLSLLDRTDSLPDDMFARVGASIAVPANQSSHSNIAQQSQAPQVLSSAYGYSYALPYYNDPKDASPSQAHMDGTEAYQPPLGTYPAYGSNMSTQPYGYTSLPTMPPRYSMTGTPFVPPNRGCISPLDLFTTSSAPSFTVSAPHTGIASTFDHSARNTSGYMSNSLAFSSTPFTPDLSLPASGPPSAHLVPSSSSPTSFGLGLAVPETPIGSDSAPDTNIESPISDSEDDELEETKEEDAEEDDDMQVEPMASPKINVGKLKIKLNKAKGGSKKDAEADDAEQGTVAVKKRSRTAQACEKCRVRKARCFGGNPCHRCTKRGFSCEFTPSRVRVAAPRAEIKPKTRRHSMHVVGASGPSHMVSGQPGVNGIIASPVPHAPLSRVQSHNHVYGNGQPRATPYSRPPISHSHSLSTGVHLPLLSPAFGVSAHMGPADMTGSQANLVMYGNPHAHTQPISQIPLPRSPVGASGMYNAAFHTIPSFEQMHPTGSNRAMQPNSVANTSSLTPAFSSSSLELSLGTALPVASQGLGLGLSIDNDEYYNFNSSPSDRSSDVPALSGSSTSSNNSGDALSTFASSGAWSSLLETSGLPSVDEDVFDFSPVQEYDGIRVVGWDDEPAGINNADPGVLTQSSSTAFSLGQQVEGVRDAAARHLYDVGSEWYGATR